MYINGAEQVYGAEQPKEQPKGGSSAAYTGHPYLLLSSQMSFRQICVSASAPQYEEPCRKKYMSRKPLSRRSDIGGHNIPRDHLLPGSHPQTWLISLQMATFKVYLVMGYA